MLLRTKVEELLEAMKEDQLDFDDLTQADRHTLVSFVFKARGTAGAGKYVGKDASIDFLENLPSGEMDSLLADPPCMKGEGTGLPKGCLRVWWWQRLRLLDFRCCWAHRDPISGFWRCGGRGGACRICAG